ncbi:MAG: hypothetical protein GYA57_14630, partial [Myxococcales bacterium]|nr:hypothetical protein [Myxococcales bacterium]
MRHREHGGVRAERGGVSRRAAALLVAAAAGAATALVAWPAGCDDDSNGTTPERPPCGVSDPAT